MKPVPNIIEGMERREVLIFSREDPDARPLPALALEDAAGVILTRWRLTWRERLIVAIFGSLWLAQATNYEAPQAIAASVRPPDVSGRARAEAVPDEAPE